MTPEIASSLAVRVTSSSRHTVDDGRGRHCDVSVNATTVDAIDTTPSLRVADIFTEQTRGARAPFYRNDRWRFALEINFETCLPRSSILLVLTIIVDFDIDKTDDTLRDTERLYES